MADVPEIHRTIDPRSGFCLKTKTFYSLRPSFSLPQISQPLSIVDYTSTCLNSTDVVSSTAFLIHATTGYRLSYSQFFERTRSLAASLQSSFPSLSKGQVALVVSPSSIHVPVIYFSLISLGVIVSPVNPLSSDSELAHVAQLSKPVIAFVSSSITHKLPSFPLGTVSIDSKQFQSILALSPTVDSPKRIEVNQSDTVAILYSSGTTGRVKGVELTHRNLIAVTASMYHNKFMNQIQKDSHPVTLFTIPLFHVFGFMMLFRTASLGDSLVLMERFDFETMLMAVEKYRVTSMPVSPPLIVALSKSELVDKYDLSSLEILGCGGAPLGKEVSEKFTARFPNIEIRQGYGLTESVGGVATMVGPDESKHYGSAGRLSVNMEAKIVDPATGKALPPGQHGELWIRGPLIMKGYVGDSESTAATLDPEGWLKTGDLCYFDSEGFLYVVDRLKELIKYKAYQVPPAELEHLLLSIPEIADAAVVPYPDEEAGQIPMAYVVRKPGSSITDADIMDMIAKQVAPYKKIRRVAFINAIPKSAGGKILRRELTNNALSKASAKL